MAIKTKADIQNELTAALNKLAVLEKEKKEFPNKLREAIQESIDDHGLDLCSSGLNEFTQKFGIEWFTKCDDFSATIYIHNLSFNVSGPYEDINQEQHDDFEKKVKEALKEVIDEFGGSYSELYLER